MPSGGSETVKWQNHTILTEVLRSCIFGNQIILTEAFDFSLDGDPFHRFYRIKWKQKCLSPLYPYIVMFYGLQLNHLNPRINRAWLYEDLNVSDLQVNGKLAQIGACMAEIAEALSSNNNGGNISPLDFLLLSHDSVESTGSIST